MAQLDVGWGRNSCGSSLAERRSVLQRHGIENVAGSPWTDTFTGNARNNSLTGAAGNMDMLFGGDGNDTLDGGAGDGDCVHGQGGNDLEYGGTGNDDVGTSIDGITITDPGNDTIYGNAGNDTRRRQLRRRRSLW